MVGLSAIAVGLVALLSVSLSEVLAQPGLSLVDGYWVGRLPWTAVGVSLAIIGATITLVSGTAMAGYGGGPVRRLVTTLAVVVAACWWFLAMLPPPQGAFCASCPPAGPDPVTMAYSQPELAVMFLLGPAVITGAMGLGAPRVRRSRVANAPII